MRIFLTWICGVLLFVLGASASAAESQQSIEAAQAKLKATFTNLTVIDFKAAPVAGELFAEAKEIGDELCRKFIFTTGDVASQESHSFLSQTGSPYLQKPFDLQEVRHLVRQVLSGALISRDELPFLTPSSPHDPDPSV